MWLELKIFFEFKKELNICAIKLKKNESKPKIFSQVHKKTHKSLLPVIVESEKYIQSIVLYYYIFT